MHARFDEYAPRRLDYYQYGVYTDQVLQNYLMPGMYVLTNLSPA